MESQKVDRRGCPPGQGIAVGANAGRIGNPAHEPTAENRLKVRTLAKVCSQELIAQAMGFSVDTLQKYYLDDFNEGKQQAIQAVGAKLLERALKGHTAEMIFYLKTHAGWTTRVEVGGPGGGPVKVDLTSFLAGKTEEELAVVESVLSALIAAGGVDVPGLVDGGAGSGARGEAPTGDGPSPEGRGPDQGEVDSV
jgi:hypothetical protein